MYKCRFDDTEESFGWIDKWIIIFLSKYRVYFHSILDYENHFSFFIIRSWISKIRINSNRISEVTVPINILYKNSRFTIQITKIFAKHVKGFYKK
jgi:hypothetical protein